jgi:hypothetical protein
MSSIAFHCPLKILLLAQNFEIVNWFDKLTIFNWFDSFDPDSLKLCRAGKLRINKLTIFGSTSSPLTGLWPEYVKNQQFCSFAAKCQ